MASFDRDGKVVAPKHFGTPSDLFDDCCTDASHCCRCCRRKETGYDSGGVRLKRSTFWNRSMNASEPFEGVLSQGFNNLFPFGDSSWNGNPGTGLY